MIVGSKLCYCADITGVVGALFQRSVSVSLRVGARGGAVMAPWP